MSEHASGLGRPAIYVGASWERIPLPYCPVALRTVRKGAGGVSDGWGESLGEEQAWFMALWDALRFVCLYVCMSVCR
jgi:hypothetical protein